MLKTLRATAALLLAATVTSGDAQAAPGSATGCVHIGPEACWYLQDRHGHVYHLVPWGPPYPPVGRVISASGDVQPPPSPGFCASAQTMFATKIAVSRKICR